MRPRSIGPSDAVPLIDLKNIDPALSSRQGLRRIGPSDRRNLNYAIEMAMRGEVDGITFAPLNNGQCSMAGGNLPTSIRCSPVSWAQGLFSEMNVLDGQWMSRVTGHMSMRDALDAITEERIGKAITLADRMMRRAGIAEPRIAVRRSIRMAGRVACSAARKSR